MVVLSTLCKAKSYKRLFTQMSLSLGYHSKVHMKGLLLLLLLLLFFLTHYFLSKMAFLPAYLILHPVQLDMLVHTRLLFVGLKSGCTEHRKREAERIN